MDQSLHGGENTESKTDQTSALVELTVGGGRQAMNEETDRRGPSQGGQSRELAEGGAQRPPRVDGLRTLSDEAADRELKWQEQKGWPR